MTAIADADDTLMEALFLADLVRLAAVSSMSNHWELSYARQETAAISALDLRAALRRVTLNTSRSGIVHPAGVVVV